MDAQQNIQRGMIVENSKEGFRQLLLKAIFQILMIFCLNKDPHAERKP